jgi:multidrug resistance efflux pump
MSLESTPSALYDVRRQQRGAERPRNAGSWKRRLLIGGAITLALCLAGTGFWVHWSLTHARMLNSQVCARVIQVSSDADGRVKELLVRPEDTVTKGQVLMRLDDSEPLARLTGAQAQEASKQSLYAEAEADLRVTQATVSAGMDAARLGVDVAKAQLARAQAQREQAKAELDKLMTGARIEDVEVAKAHLASANVLEELAALEVTQSEQLVGEGIDSAHMLQVKKTQLATQKNAVREAELNLARLQAGPTDEERRISEQVLAAREADLSLARSGLQQAEAEQARAEAMKAQVALGEEKVKAADADLSIAKAGTDAARAALSLMTIRSKVDGTVIRTFDKEGEFCRTGTTTMLVSDDSAGRWVEGYVTERDAARVRAGQKAYVEIVVGSGQTVEAEVLAVSLATSSLGREAPASPARAALGGAEQVWVKLRLAKQDPHWLPGNSARATIETP